MGPFRPLDFVPGIGGVFPGGEDVYQPLRAAVCGEPVSGALLS